MTNKTAFDLNSVGNLHEDILDRLYNSDPDDTPVSALADDHKATNPVVSWIEEGLNSISTTGVVDGATVTANSHRVGARKQNHAQTFALMVELTDRAQNVNSIGTKNAIARSVKNRNKEIRRNIEATILGIQSSVEDNGDDVAGRTGGLGAWLETNTIHGSGGSAGGYDVDTGLVDAPTPGAAVAMSMANFNTVAQGCYNNGGNVSHIVTIPALKAVMSSYFIKTFRLGQLIQGSDSKDEQVKGTVDIFRGDFGTYKLVPNRSQQRYHTAGANAAVYFIDPEYLAIGWIQKPHGKPLAKTGLSQKMLISCDFALKVLNEKAMGAVFDVAPGAAMLDVNA